MSNSSLKPFADLKVKIREYEDEDGKTKGVYQKIGTLWSTPHGSNMAIKIDAIPVQMFKKGEHQHWDGWANVFKIEGAEQEIETDQNKTEDFNV